MEWREGCEQGAAGFLGYGLLACILAPSPIAITASALVGGLVHYGLAVGLRIPWRQILQQTPSAYVSVTPGRLFFREVSATRFERIGYIRVQDMTAKELLRRLDGKRLDKETLPQHMRLALEQKRSLDLPWEAIEPFLKAVA
jgi:hypothetical protein